MMILRKHLRISLLSKLVVVFFLIATEVAFAAANGRDGDLVQNTLDETLMRICAKNKQASQRVDKVHVRVYCRLVATKEVLWGQRWSIDGFLERTDTVLLRKAKDNASLRYEVSAIDRSGRLERHFTFVTPGKEIDTTDESVALLPESVTIPGKYNAWRAPLDKESSANMVIPFLLQKFAVNAFDTPMPLDELAAIAKSVSFKEDQNDVVIEMVHPGTHLKDFVDGRVKIVLDKSKNYAAKSAIFVDDLEGAFFGQEVTEFQTLPNGEGWIPKSVMITSGRVKDGTLLPNEATNRSCEVIVSKAKDGAAKFAFPDNSLVKVLLSPVKYGGEQAPTCDVEYYLGSKVSEIIHPGEGCGLRGALFFREIK